jgi:hypothetical protein
MLSLREEVGSCGETGLDEKGWNLMEINSGLSTRPVQTPSCLCKTFLPLGNIYHVRIMGRWGREETRE